MRASLAVYVVKCLRTTAFLSNARLHWSEGRVGRTSELTIVLENTSPLAETIKYIGIQSTNERQLPPQITAIMRGVAQTRPRDSVLFDLLKSKKAKTEAGRRSAVPPRYANAGRRKRKNGLSPEQLTPAFLPDYLE